MCKVNTTILLISSLILSLTYYIPFTGENLIKLDPPDSKEGLAKHGFGKFRPLFHSREHMNGEKHMTAATKIQEESKLAKNAMNFSNEIVPMERVRS
jgi:hypothetical protein